MIMVLTYRPELRERMVEQLRQSGYEVIVPPHREDVVTAVDRTHPDLIVLDLYLANPSGVDMLRRIRRAGYRGKVIALGGASQRGVLREAQSLGVDGVISGAGLCNMLDIGPVVSAVRGTLHRAS